MDLSIDLSIYLSSDTTFTTFNSNHVYVNISIFIIIGTFIYLFIYIE